MCKSGSTSSTTSSSTDCPHSSSGALAAAAAAAAAGSSKHPRHSNMPMTDTGSAQQQQQQQQQQRRKRRQQLSATGDSSNHNAGAAQANQNTIPSGKMLTSKFRGVCWNKKNKRWQAAINSGGKYIYLGSFTSEHDAARQFDRAAIKIRGKKAKLNHDLEGYVDDSGKLLEDFVLPQPTSRRGSNSSSASSQTDIAAAGASSSSSSSGVLIGSLSPSIELLQPAAATDVTAAAAAAAAAAAGSSQGMDGSFLALLDMDADSDDILAQLWCGDVTEQQQQQQLPLCGSSCVPATAPACFQPQFNFEAPSLTPAATGASTAAAAAAPMHHANAFKSMQDTMQGVTRGPSRSQSSSPDLLVTNCTGVTSSPFQSQKPHHQIPGPQVTQATVQGPAVTAHILGPGMTKMGLPVTPELLGPQVTPAAWKSVVPAGCILDFSVRAGYNMFGLILKYDMTPQRSCAVFTGRNLHALGVHKDAADALQTVLAALKLLEDNAAAMHQQQLLMQRSASILGTGLVSAMPVQCTEAAAASAAAGHIVTGSHDASWSNTMMTNLMTHPPVATPRQPAALSHQLPHCNVSEALLLARQAAAEQGFPDLTAFLQYIGSSSSGCSTLHSANRTRAL